MLRHCWWLCSCVLRCGTADSARIKNGAHSGGQKGVSVWKKYRAWDGAQPFETVLRTKNGEWLQTQGFDPFTQSAAYYRLTGDAPETNTVEVSVKNASRDAVYAPASMEKVTDGDVHERRDALLKGRGLFSIRNYTVTEVSGARPSELMVAENWVSSPQTEEQAAYAQAESVYRSFVYDAYTAADEDLLPVLNRLFWQDYDDENDGVYSALSRIREVLKAQVRYSETAEAAPDNADPIAYFLTDSRKGNAVLYASATVHALRAHGIPARYAEGYYLPIAKTQSSADGTAALTGQDAHAWAEVCFDGIGWLPVDATPGYYFDAVALQQMVSLPDTVRKPATIDEDRSGGRAVRHRWFRAVQAAACGEKRGCGWIRYCQHRYSAVHAAAVRDGADTRVPAVGCGTQTAQNVDRGACAAVAEADVQADFPLGH